MADNVTALANTGAGTDVFATDNITGVNFPRSKITLGADGVNDGDVSSSNPMPVSLASVPAHAVTNAGTFATQVDGAALTALQLIDNIVLAEDAIHASGDPGVMALAVRQDADTSAVGADGDYHALLVNESGRLKVSTVAADLPATTGTITGSAQTVVCDVTKASNVCLYVTGTFAGVNLTFEASIDGTNYFGIQMVRSNANTVELTTGVIAAAPAYCWEASANAYTHFRVRSTAYTSGTANVRILPGVYATEPVIATQTTPVTITSGTVTTVTNITNQGHLADNAAFTDGTTRLMMSGYILDETAGTALTENDGAAARVDSKRAQVMVIEDGTTRGSTKRVTVKAASTAIAATDIPMVVALSPNSVINPLIELSASYTRPADTAVYAAGDCLSNSTSAPTAGGLTFASAAKRSGLGGIIKSAVITSTAAPGTTLQGRVVFFKSAPTAVNDNAALALSDADALLVVGSAEFALVVDFINNAQARLTNLDIPFVCSGSADLRALVQVLNAYTPASAEVLTIALTILQTD